MSLRVATLELDVRTGDVDGNLAAARAGVRRASELGARLVALPEMWPTSFVASAGRAELEASDAAVEALARDAAELDVAVVGSSFGDLGEGALPTNRAHVLDGGRVVGTYDKVHLFSPTAEHLAFTAGDAPPPVVTLGKTDVKVAPVVCYDLRFPAVTRAAFRAGAEVLVAVAQWPDARAPHWRALVRGRAAEAEGFVVACNRVGEDEIGRRRMRLTFSGDAAVVGPSGEDVPRVARETLEAVGRDHSRLSVHEIDVGEARALRRAVPVAKDERLDVVRSWLASD